MNSKSKSKNNFLDYFSKINFLIFFLHLVVAAFELTTLSKICCHYHGPVTIFNWIFISGSFLKKVAIENLSNTKGADKAIREAG